MNPLAVNLALSIDSLREWATVICFVLFSLIALRLWIVGRTPYERVSEVPLSDDEIVDPRPTRKNGGEP